MLKAHVDASEDLLLAISKIPANAGHSLHIGTPREAFIWGFLKGHLSKTVAIGTGEIIDASSKPKEQRHQIDIVIYRRNYPRLDIGGGIRVFFAESVVATIEVKSMLNKEELRKAVHAAKAIKALGRNFISSMSAGYQPPSILSYVVAYDGPARMKTVYEWFPEISAAEGIVYPDLPVSDDDRVRTPCPSLDAVFVLGKGFIHFGNTPSGFFQSKEVEKDEKMKWAIGESRHGSLLLLFMFLTAAVSGMTAAYLNPMPYLKSFSVEECLIGR